MRQSGNRCGKTGPLLTPPDSAEPAWMVELEDLVVASLGSTRPAWPGVTAMIGEQGDCRRAALPACSPSPPGTVFDVGVGPGTPWLYSTFPAAMLVLNPPSRSS
jgi:hypothetical protein